MTSQIETKLIPEVQDVEDVIMFLDLQDSIRTLDVEQVEEDLRVFNGNKKNILHSAMWYAALALREKEEEKIKKAEKILSLLFSEGFVLDIDLVALFLLNWTSGSPDFEVQDVLDFFSSISPSQSSVLNSLDLEALKEESLSRHRPLDMDVDEVDIEHNPHLGRFRE